MEDKLKVVAKGALALFAIALGVTVATEVSSYLYDFRLILAAAGGAFGYRPLVKLAEEKISVLRGRDYKSVE